MDKALILVAFLWIDPRTENLCAAPRFEDVPLNVQVITEERVLIGGAVAEGVRQAIIKDFVQRNTLLHCPREKDKEA